MAVKANGLGVRKFGVVLSLRAIPPWRESEAILVPSAARDLLRLPRASPSQRHRRITSSSRICGTPRNHILNRLYQSQRSLKPRSAEFHGMASMGRICQTVVSALKDTNLFRGTQVMKDLPRLIHGNKLILLAVDHEAIGYFR